MSVLLSFFFAGKEMGGGGEEMSLKEFFGGGASVRLGGLGRGCWCRRKKSPDLNLQRLAPLLTLYSSHKHLRLHCESKGVHIEPPS